MPGYHLSKVDRSVPSIVRVRVYISKWAPARVPWFCCFFTSPVVRDSAQDCTTPHFLMDRLARDLDDLRKLVLSLTKRGIRIAFVHESLTFTGEDSPMANLMLSVMGAFAEFERALIRERQREGIAMAKQRGAYRGRKKSLSDDKVAELTQRVAGGEQKSQHRPRPWYQPGNPVSVSPGSSLRPMFTSCRQNRCLANKP